MLFFFTGGSPKSKTGNVNKAQQRVAIGDQKVVTKGRGARGGTKKLIKRRGGDA
jgi:hypothetical protein